MGVWRGQILHGVTSENSLTSMANQLSTLLTPLPCGATEVAIDKNTKESTSRSIPLQGCLIIPP